MKKIESEVPYLYTYNFLSPIGNLAVTATKSYIVNVRFQESTDSGKPEKCEVAEECVQQLSEYFIGTRRQFNIPVLTDGTDFQNKVWKYLTTIPFGKTVSYSQMAAALDNLKGIRAIGSTNGKNKILIILPCHRVIGKDGSLVGFAGELWRKKWLLEHEARVCGNEQLRLNL
jgi:methylated-DNA-[protein]-cysteine S-methyltransferase